MLHQFVRRKIILGLVTSAIVLAPALSSAGSFWCWPGADIFVTPASTNVDASVTSRFGPLVASQPITKTSSGAGGTFYTFAQHSGTIQAEAFASEGQTSIEFLIDGSSGPFPEVGLTLQQHAYVTFQAGAQAADFSLLVRGGAEEFINNLGSPTAWSSVSVFASISPYGTLMSDSIYSQGYVAVGEPSNGVFTELHLDPHQSITMDMFVKGSVDAGTPTPAPGAALPMLMGLAGYARRRRAASRNQTRGF